jgi:hypothetical protein
VWDVSIIDTAIKDFYNKSMDTMVEALKMNLTVSILEHLYTDLLVSSIQLKGVFLVSKTVSCSSRMLF